MEYFDSPEENTEAYWRDFLTYAEEMLRDHAYPESMIRWYMEELRGIERSFDVHLLGNLAPGGISLLLECIEERALDSKALRGTLNWLREMARYSRDQDAFAEGGERREEIAALIDGIWDATEIAQPLACVSEKMRQRAMILIRNNGMPESEFEWFDFLEGTVASELHALMNNEMSKLTN